MPRPHNAAVERREETKTPGGHSLGAPAVMTRAPARPGRGMVSSNQPRRNGPGGGGESPPLRVLLVTPDENDYAVARGLLTEIPTRRYAVAWARTYEEGVAAVRRDAHDVYLVDYRLGTRSGIDLLADARGCRGPIIS